ncbi:MAG: hypothetical protein H6713_16315 [Myxococcales bacterium]|nr:hypothetical protein [Myxococcales bacterium]
MHPRAGGSSLASCAASCSARARVVSPASRRAASSRSRPSFWYGLASGANIQPYSSTSAGSLRCSSSSCAQVDATRSRVRASTSSGSIRAPMSTAARTAASLTRPPVAARSTRSIASSASPCTTPSPMTCQPDPRHSSRRPPRHPGPSSSTSSSPLPRW